MAAGVSSFHPGFQETSLGKREKQIAEGVQDHCSLILHRALTLFPIEHEHEAEQHHATWPHVLDDAAVKKIAVGEKLE